MKKKLKLAIIILIVAAVVIGGVFAVVKLVRGSQAKELINEQNYIAAKLLELGDYRQGRALAMKSEQAKSNSTSRRIVSLSYGFEADFELAAQTADKWLENESDALLKKVSDVSNAKIDEYASYSSGGYGGYYDYGNRYQLDDETRTVLASLLKEVSSSIKVKRSISSMQAMIDAYTTGLSDALMTTLERDDSLLAKSIKVDRAITMGDLATAYELAEDLLESSGSFEDRARAANIVAAEGIFTGGADIEPIKRAINFIEVTTPQAQKVGAPYALERAFLYHQADEDETAQKIMADLLTVSEPKTAADIIMRDIADSYQALPGGNSYDSGIVDNYNQLADMLTFIDTDKDDGFFAFLQEFLDQYFNGIIIREIDTVDFPTVRVRLNAGKAGESGLKKRDFNIYDLGDKISSIKLVTPEKAKKREDTTIMLVVDRSGSMSGQPMTDTKAAVSNFVSSIGDDTPIGLVTFDDTAVLEYAPDTRRAPLLAAVNSIRDGGGTSIYSGLEVALESLRGVNGRKIVMLLSDGADGSAGMIDDVIKRLNAEGITVYTIGFGGADTNYLKYIAENCGGKLMYADTSALLGEIYTEIGETMDNDYIIEFVAKGDLEDYSRDLTVAVDKLYSTAEREYHVGVTAEEIAAEKFKPAGYDCFRQFGGSHMN